MTEERSERETTRPSENGVSDSIEEMVLRCLALRIEERESLLEETRARDPVQAQAVRERLESLERLGLAGPSPGRVPASDSDRFGDFRLIRCLGTGGMGAVYLARQESLGRQVALKIVRPEFVHSEGARERFRREAHAAAQLNDPAICRVFEVGEVDGTPYIAMQFVEGETLAVHIREARAAARPAETPGAISVEHGTRTHSTSASPASREAIIDMVRRIEKAAQALHTAHEHGLIHRDIKPGNIMITPDGEPVILDFGLVREEASEQPSLTHTGDVLGTPAYMSPEQISPGESRVDRRTDIYSLGATLYECLTLERPFEAGTREELYRRILTTDCPDPHRKNRQIPFDLRVVLEMAMEKDRGRRYATALELAEDLRRVRKFEPVRARRAGPILRLRRWVQRNPVVATVLVVLSLAIAANSWLYWRAEQSRAAIEEGIRQSDSYVLTGLELEAESRNWPARPESVPAMEAWLVEAAALAGRLVAYQRELAALRARSLPYTEEDARRDRESHPGRDALLEFKRQKAEREKGRDESPDPVEEEPDPSSVEWLRKRQPVNDAEIEVLEQEVSERRTWKFEQEVDAVRHGELSVLVEKLERFMRGGARPGTLERIRRQRDAARDAYRITVENHRAAWDEAIASIADPRESPAYDGLRIRPQVGLVPVGKDRVSGLWEFVHPATGETPHRSPHTGDLQLTESTGLVFVLLPGGKFLMGATTETGSPNRDPAAQANEGPVHEVTLAPFLLSKYEMTQAQWTRVTGFNPCTFNPDYIYSYFSPSLLHPVETVSWVDCHRVLGREGLCLPTEAQWAYAARSGDNRIWATGSTIESLRKRANLRCSAHATVRPSLPKQHEQYTEDGYVFTSPVGSFPPNAFGLHDMTGNIHEWCLDLMGPYTRPVLPGTGQRIVPATPGRPRVIRGGNYFLMPVTARIATRIGLMEHVCGARIGVRPARALDR